MLQLLVRRPQVGHLVTQAQQQPLACLLRSVLRPQLFVENLFNKKYALKGAFFSGASVGRPRIGRRPAWRTDARHRTVAACDCANYTLRR